MAQPIEVQGAWALRKLLVATDLIAPDGSTIATEPAGAILRVHQGSDLPWYGPSPANGWIAVEMRPKAGQFWMFYSQDKLPEDTAAWAADKGKTRRGWMPLDTPAIALTPSELKALGQGDTGSESESAGLSAVDGDNPDAAGTTEGDGTAADDPATGKGAGQHGAPGGPQTDDASGMLLVLLGVAAVVAALASREKGESQ